MGWADAALGDYQAALAPWMELRERNLLDAAVQESYLAVPYAYGKLNANAQAADILRSALKSFDAENVRLDSAIGAHPATATCSMTCSAGRNEAGAFGWFWQLQATCPMRPSRATCTRCWPATISRRA